MPDQGATPGQAGQTAAPTGTTAGAAPSTGSATSPATDGGEPQWAKDIRTGLDSMKAENKRGWDTIRSTTEKRLNDLRAEFASRRRQTATDESEDFTFDRGDGSRPEREARDTPRVRSPREDVREQRRALSDYRANYSDGSDYHDDVLAIANDTERAGRFLMRDEEGNVDYYASLEAIHQHVELEALRKFKAEKAEADDARREQRREQRRDATISGGGASGGEQKSPEDMTEEELLAEMDRQGMVNQNDRPRAGR